MSHLIPLYRSERFLAIIEENVRELAGRDVEIILADRNGDHAFCYRLQERLSDVANLRVICDASNMNWVENIADLITLARGQYLQILPHDDSTTKEATRRLCAALDQQPDAVLACGQVRAFDLDGNRLEDRDELNAEENPDARSWTLDDVLRLVWQGRFNGAFKGVIRRQVAQDARCRFKATPGTILSERVWLFSLGLAGRLAFVPVDALAKRYYPESTHRQWEFGSQAYLDATELMVEAVKARFGESALANYAVTDVLENGGRFAESVGSKGPVRFEYLAAGGPDAEASRATDLRWSGVDQYAA
ncbi:glycosyltransferase family A protein [Shimia isoporae]|uniref:glycosyltransferase family A protein n=1 Tax=Shimia isoporae TaxID=647720 RepID=UPI001404A4C1|nr:glycosyltransferase family A protein [Shimia isoporae]